MKGDELVQRFVGLARDAICLADTLPRTVAGRHVATQLIRSGTSAGANYEEARGAESRQDFIHKLGISLKELHETRFWLRIVAECRWRPTNECFRLLATVEDLARILGASKRTARLAAAARCP